MSKYCFWERCHAPWSRKTPEMFCVSVGKNLACAWLYNSHPAKHPVPSQRSVLKVRWQAVLHFPAPCCGPWTAPCSSSTAAGAWIEIFTLVTPAKPISLCPSAAAGCWLWCFFHSLSPGGQKAAGGMRAFVEGKHNDSRTEAHLLRKRCLWMRGRTDSWSQTEGLTNPWLGSSQPQWPWMKAKQMPYKWKATASDQNTRQTNTVDSNHCHS